MTKPSPSTPFGNFEQNLEFAIADIIEPEEGQAVHVYLAAIRKAERIMNLLRSKGLINNG